MQPFVAPNTTVVQFRALVAPLLKQLTALHIAYNASTPATSYATFDALYHALFRSAGAGGGGSPLLGGRLLSQTDVVKNGSAITRAIAGLVEAGHVFVGVAVNPGHAVPDPDAQVSAVHPVWRKAASSTSWLFEPPACLSEAGRQQALRNLTQLGDALRAASPTSAVYANQGDVNEPDWQQAFWGSNYKKLAAIKAKYDPNGVFWVPATPGAENWALADEKTLCKTS